MENFDPETVAEAVVRRLRHEERRARRRRQRRNRRILSLLGAIASLVALSLLLAISLGVLPTVAPRIEETPGRRVVTDALSATAPD
jgi:hypothetical protein